MGGLLRGSGPDLSSSSEAMIAVSFPTWALGVPAARMAGCFLGIAFGVGLCFARSMTISLTLISGTMWPKRLVWTASTVKVLPGQIIVELGSARQCSPHLQTATNSRSAGNCFAKRPRIWALVQDKDLDCPLKSTKAARPSGRPTSRSVGLFVVAKCLIHSWGSSPDLWAGAFLQPQGFGCLSKE